MNKNLIIFALAACAVAPTLGQTNIGVSIGINQPGVYGRIDIGSFPQPRLIYPQPIVIVQTPIAVYQRPIYLYVPSGQQKKWANYCGRYNACGQPVYFVQEEWVRERYEERHDRGGKSKGKGKKNKD